jgi:hypothetical protein
MSRSKKDISSKSPRLGGRRGLIKKFFKSLPLEGGESEGVKFLY